MPKRQISLRLFLILSLLFVMLFSCIAFGRFFSQTVFDEIALNTQTISANTTRVQTETVNQALESIESLAFTIQNNTLVNNSLAPESGSTLQELQNNEQLSQFLQQLSYSYEDVTGILLLTDQKSIYNYALPFGFYETSRLPQGDLLVALNSGNESGYVATFPNDIIKNIEVENLFCYYEKMYYKNQYAATLCILINADYFRYLFRDTISNGEILMISDEDRVVYPVNFSSDDFYNYNAVSSTVTSSQIGEMNYLSSSQTLSNGWTLTDFIPTTHIEMSISRISQQIILSLGLIFCMYFCCIVIISHYLSSNFHQLYSRMSSMKEWKQKPLGPIRLKEVDELSYQFNKMIKRIDELLHDVKQEQQQLSRMELELLQARINPHFLYNTLDAINWIAIERGVDEISEMSSDLATMFRCALNNGSEIATLSNELSHLNTYLNIQKYRFSNRFTFTSNVDPQLKNKYILNIVLQPFAENSLLHGLRSAQDTIDISLSITAENDVYHIVFTDNGAGCDADLLNDYLASTCKSTKGYGIKNIHQRIQLHFGQEYGVHYHPVLVGTQVEITLPVMESPQEEH